MAYRCASKLKNTQQNTYSTYTIKNMARFKNTRTSIHGLHKTNKINNNAKKTRYTDQNTITKLLKSLESPKLNK
jgi:hypothetical protein